ncbi:transcription-repair coupling factor (superfamily II helicase) [Desulfurobacterium pacificum]|uniref:Transcription-repair-coupling factor n=1 Tax=Desulfurobacterium pacificum TaxID=240166 RepID=A0ABY1NK71_9BACT|nr:transcription-repair coupling factor [Desulfurobacterium pacificum]SMP11100.1 transcription-repair coupling factor (superfamily II helicase) [Desulfurobacterium pacificum]
MFKRALKVLKGSIKSGEKPKVYGLPGASKSLLLKEILPTLKEQVLVISPSELIGEALTEDFKRQGIKAVFLPSWDVPPLDVSSPLSLYQFKRLSSLYRLIENYPQVVVSTPQALMQKVIPPEILIERVLSIKKGEEINYDSLSKSLSSMGYRRVDSEPEEGEFSVKGDHVEVVMPLGSRVSVELFGDEVERITVNGEEREKVEIFPLLEVPIDKETLKKIEDIYPEVAERHLILGELSGADKLLPEIFPLTSVKDYLSSNFATVLIEPDQIRTASESFLQQVKENYEILKREGVPAAKPEKFVEDVWFGDYTFAIYEKPINGGINFGVKPLPNLSEENVNEVLSQLLNYEVRIITATETFKQEIEKALKKLSVKATVEKGISSGGFRLDEEKIAWVVEGDFLPEIKQKKEDITALEPGTLIVHRDYGIGIFQGIVSRNIGGKTYDFIEIEYAGGEKLFAPFTQIDRIYKYSGYRGKSPKLDKLGGTSWKNLERKIKASLVKFAKELAELYKERKNAVGESLKGDENLLREFEKRFPYRLTPDQAKAIKDVYRDMESEKPMDRLICGDVGYGKTEVAMRAAMKAVTSGKQVAVIAPTTVLVDQHYRTFKKRFKGFPVNIEVISRFKSKKEQKEILEKLEKGEIDIIIGTHRLTQDDVKFKDLGLLIIDEEHKFGVKTKEKLTKLKKNIDVLYLSATPIPRTLYSALSGFRDISVIETPPPGRRGTKVVVSKYSDRILKTAIERELERNGQVFIVQNDIEELEPLKTKVEEMFPGVPVEIVHGQMKSDKIERIMHNFFEGKIKILISTSIVESGLDVPSANTLIVIGAERFGLSQLYQLKGRVGRGVEKGYCYLLISPKTKLTPEAVKRLEAMKKLSPLGGGFQLAVKDLEIRGAGTLLGPKQSGYVNTVGLDLYLKLFEEVSQEKEEEDVKITLPWEAFIPEDYVEDVKERVKIYAELASSENPDEAVRKLREVHGYIPDPVINIFKTMKLKKLAKQIGVKEITVSPSGKAIIAFSDTPNVQTEKLVEMVKSRKATFTPDKKLYVNLKDFDDLISLLEELKE